MKITDKTLKELKALKQKDLHLSACEFLREHPEKINDVIKLNELWEQIPEFEAYFSKSNKWSWHWIIVENRWEEVSEKDGDYYDHMRANSFLPSILPFEERIQLQKKWAKIFDDWREAKLKSHE